MVLSLSNRLSFMQISPHISSSISGRLQTNDRNKETYVIRNSDPIRCYLLRWGLGVANVVRESGTATRRGGEIWGSLRHWLLGR